MENKSITPSVRRAMNRLGADIQVARKKRRLSQKDFASKMGVSVATVQRLEAGEPGVAMGVVAMAFSALGAIQKFNEAFDVTTDEIGLVMDQGQLPQRVRKAGKGVNTLTGEPVASKVEGTAF